MKLIAIILSFMIGIFTVSCGEPSKRSSDAADDSTAEDVTEVSQMKIDIEAGGTHLTASFADSTAAKELAEKLKAEPVTVTLNEYGGFEKVGKLPWPLTRTDASTETGPGDIMLYQGDQMTIFYNSNSWSYTKLGYIDNITKEELKAILGESDITVTLSLK